MFSEIPEAEKGCGCVQRLNRDFGNPEAPGAKGKAAYGSSLDPLLTTPSFFPFRSGFGWGCRKEGRGQEKSEAQAGLCPSTTEKQVKFVLFWDWDWPEKGPPQQGLGCVGS